jgi:hypothetical protein
VPRRFAVLCTAAALLGGCGNSRTPVPSLTAPATPHGLQTVRYRGAGFQFRAPANWTVATESGPLITVVSSGAAVVAVWRYLRLQPPPTAGAMPRERAALITAARRRDRGLSLIRSRLVMVGKAPAIELDSIQRLGGALRRVRSLHVFVPGAELVLEQYAPVNIFHAIDHTVFSPLKRSLRLFPPRA